MILTINNPHNKSIGLTSLEQINYFCLYYFEKLYRWGKLFVCLPRSTIVYSKHTSTQSGKKTTRYWIFKRPLSFSDCLFHMLEKMVSKWLNDKNIPYCLRIKHPSYGTHPACPHGTSTLSKLNKCTPSWAHQYLHLTLHQRGWFGWMEKVPSLLIILWSTQQQEQLLLLPSENNIRQKK